MQEWKQTIADMLVKEASKTKIVTLKDVAASIGINHIKRQDAMDIMRDAESKCSGMKLVQPGGDGAEKSSFFQTACLVDKSLDGFDGNGYVKNLFGTMVFFDVAVPLMDDKIREKLHQELSPCTEQEFFTAYEKEHLEKFGELWELSKDNPVY